MMMKNKYLILLCTILLSSIIVGIILNKNSQITDPPPIIDPPPTIKPDTLLPEIRLSLDDIRTTIHYNISQDDVKHKAYILSFSEKFNLPNWVAWRLTAKHVDGPVKIFKNYQVDNKVIPFARVEPNALSGSGYEYAQMCPAEDNQWDPVAMQESFLMSNICPQTRELHNGVWKRLEKKCRRWAQKEGCIYICCGPIFESYDSLRYIIPKNGPSVAIPKAFFKVVLSLNPGKEKAIGFYFRNDSSRQTMGEAVRSVDEIEEMMGFDFFDKLSDELENIIETYNKLSLWN